MEGYVAEVLDVESQVDAGAFGATVAEKVADSLEWRALTEQVDRQRMAQTVRSLKRDGEAAAACPRLEHFRDGSALECPGWRPYAEEDLPIWQRRAPVLNVVQQGATDLGR